MIKTTFATELFIIANTKAIKLNDITKPPNSPAKPAFFIVLTLSLNVLNEIFASLLVATTASILEAIPVADLDNLIIPIVTGFVIFLFV